MELSTEQTDAVNGVLNALNGGKIVVALTGAAGTGKTTVLDALAECLPDDTVLAAPTWRAANIMADKTGLKTTSLHAAVMRPEFLEPLPALMRYLDAGDYDEPPPHSVRIRWEGDWWQEVENTSDALSVLGIRPMDWIKRWVAKDKQPGILVVDEASMLGVENIAMAQDVYAAIVLIGDPNQLPPVKDKAVLHLVPPEQTFRLTEIHRQAADSPVLQIAYEAHKTGKITAPSERYTRDHAASGVPIMCWRNAVRLKRTMEVRVMLNYPDNEVVTGEPLVCRAFGQKDRDRGLVNNTLWTVMECRGDHHLIIDDAGNELSVQLAMEEFEETRGVPFRFGYALTCHTAQGGEWPIVGIDGKDANAIAYVLKEGAKSWAYTAATRASEKVFLVGEVG